MAKNVTLSIGEHVNVDIYKPRKGTFPIGKVGGLFCKLYIPKNVGHVEYGSTCYCKVTKVSDKSAEVSVVEVVRSAAANNFAIQQALKDTVKYHNTSNKKHKNQPFLEKIEALNNASPKKKRKNEKTGQA